VDRGGLRRVRRGQAAAGKAPEEWSYGDGDVEAGFKNAALDIPDRETPVGARGIGEPPVGAGCNAILNALADAVGDEVFRRAPVTPDVILASLDAGHAVGEHLTAHI
jgi:CO/xanthine dehydrogenase Mo-binding subunit